MTIEKKYFSISEVVQKTGLPIHKLRYIEKINPIISIVKIRDRRYYTIDTINYIKKFYTESEAKITEPKNVSREQNENILIKINRLLEGFHKLTE